MTEFARFEEKLKQQKGVDATASTVGKGSLNAAEAWILPPWQASEVEGIPRTKLKYGLPRGGVLIGFSMSWAFNKPLNTWASSCDNCHALLKYRDAFREHRSVCISVPPILGGICSRMWDVAEASDPASMWESRWLTGKVSPRPLKSNVCSLGLCVINIQWGFHSWVKNFIYSSL